MTVICAAMVNGSRRWYGANSRDAASRPIPNSICATAVELAEGLVWPWPLIWLDEPPPGAKVAETKAG